MKIPKNISIRDVHQWLRGGWCLVDNKVVKVVDVRETDKGDCCVTVSDPDSREFIELGRKELKRIDIIWPRTCCINHKGSGVYVERVASRQWRRAYYPDGVQCHVPMLWDLLCRNPGGAPSVERGSAEFVTDLFFPKYFNYNEAVKKLDAGEVPTIAISPNIILGKQGSVYPLFLRGNEAGYVDNNEVICTDDKASSRLHKYLERAGYEGS